MPSFAQKEMQRYGWSEGKGLGRTENGMKSAIKVKLKNNTGGLGHDQGAEFSFHWWDHIFNKAASSFKVNETEDGVSLEKCEGKKVTPLLISNKRGLPTRLANKTLLYGTFVKAGTYDSNKVQDEVTREFSSDDSSDSEDESVEGDKKGLINDTLQKMYLKTGLTGHKAARHGHSLNGKLQRLTQQEERELPKSSNTEFSENNQSEVTETIEKNGTEMHQECDGSSDTTRKIKKKKKKKEKSDSLSTNLDKSAVDSEVKMSKKKKKMQIECDAADDTLSPSLVTEVGETVSVAADASLTTKKSLKHQLDGENVCPEQPKKKKKKKNSSLDK